MNNLRQILDSLLSGEGVKVHWVDDYDGAIDRALIAIKEARRKELEGAKEDAATLRRRIKALEMDSYNKDFLRVFRRIADRLDKEAIGNYPIRR